MKKSKAQGNVVVRPILFPLPPRWDVYMYMACYAGMFIRDFSKDFKEINNQFSLSRKD